MRHNKKWREKCPKTLFETRALPVVGGVRHLVTMEQWYWKKLNMLVEVGFYESLDEITQVCTRHALKRNEKSGQDFNHAFSEVMMYFIYGNYQHYRRTALGVANNFWPLHF